MYFHAHNKNDFNIKSQHDSKLFLYDAREKV